MEVNENLRNTLFEVIDNQIKADDPKETKITLKRLQDSGYTKFESKQLIGQCVALEIFNTIKKNETFNEKRYIKNLTNLPKPPKD